MSLMVDFNQGLHLGEALERCHAIDDLGLAWIEEPIVYDNLEGYARLTADLKTPVQIGENFYGPRALYTALQMKACDYVMPDFMRIGGVTGWQRAAAIAAAAGIPISTHLYPEVAAHVMRVSETAHWLEWQDWANPISQQPYEVKAGKLRQDCHGWRRTARPKGASRCQRRSAGHLCVPGDQSAARCLRGYSGRQAPG
jgi:mandelate racemase